MPGQIILNKYERQYFSQSGEDGILLEIFGRIGVKKKIFVEFGIGNSLVANSTLFFMHGWNGLMLESNEVNQEKARISFQKYLGRNPLIAKAFVTAENINILLQNFKIFGEIDLLSIDIDGNDYWVWEAINVINPRVVIIEYNASLGPDRCVAIPYNPKFVWGQKNHTYFHGASLRALYELGKKKGYTLICCDSNGVNAFFIRNDANKFLYEERQQRISSFHPLDPCKAFYPPAYRLNREPLEEQMRRTEKLGFVEV